MVGRDFRRNAVVGLTSFLERGQFVFKELAPFWLTVANGTVFAPLVEAAVITPALVVARCYIYGLYTDVSVL